MTPKGKEEIGRGEYRVYKDKPFPWGWVVFGVIVFLIILGNA